MPRGDGTGPRGPGGGQRQRPDPGRVEVAWAVPLRGALSAPACVRNAGIANRMNAAFPAFSGKCPKCDAR